MVLQFFIDEYLGINSFINSIIYILSFLEMGLYSAVGFALYAPLDLQRKRQIFADRSPWEQHILLGHIAAVMVLPGNGAAVDTDVAGLRLQQTIGHAKNGALAAAADADDAVKRAWCPRLC